MSASFNNGHRLVVPGSRRKNWGNMHRRSRRPLSVNTVLGETNDTAS